MPQCRSCNLVKDASDYRSFTKGGRTYKRKDCKFCEKKFNSEWRAENPNYGKEWYAENKERMLIVNREYAKNNRERLIQARREWEVNNRDKCRAKRAKRRCAKLNATVSWANSEAILEFYSLSQRLGKWLGTKFHVDHIIPLIHRDVCGLHNEFNLQILTESENSAKGNKFNPDDFNVVQTKERQEMNKYFNLDTDPDTTDTGSGEPPKKPPVKPVGG